MTFADSNRASIRYIPESTATWGTIPTGGSSRALRFTSSTLSASKETVVSDELRADRMVSAVPEVGAMSEGDISFELSAGSQDDFLQAFLLGTWTRPMTFDYFKGATVAWTTISVLTISGSDVSKYFTVGRRVKVEGFVTDANNGYFQVSAIAFGAGDTTITVTTATSVIESASSATKVLDANDVIVMNSANIRLATAGASTIDSNGTNDFTAAVAAGQLVAGQKIFIDAPVSDITFDNVDITWTGNGATGDQITVTDGVQVKVLTAGVDYTNGGTVTATAIAFAAAINTLRVLSGFNIKADNTVGVVTVWSTNNNASFAVAETTDVGLNFSVAVKTSATFPTTRGFYTITSASDDVLGVTPQPPTVGSPGAVNIKGSLLRNPGDVSDITPQSFTMETGFLDVDKHFIQNGMRIGTFSLDVSSGAIVTGTMAMQGKETAVLLTERLGAAPYDILASTATEVMNATTNVGNLTKNGAVLTTAVQSLTLEGDATLRNQNAVGSKFPRGIGTGRFNLTGTITAYFEDLTLYNDFLQHNTVAIGWDFTDQDGNTYYYTLPAIKITSDPVQPDGIDSDVVEQIEWSALRDSATQCMLQVDRFSSIFPV